MRSGWRFALGLGIVGGLGACGSGGGDDAKVCKQMSTLCQEHGELTCLTADDWRDMRKDLGEAPVRQFRACVLAADACPELAACLFEVGADALRTLDDEDLRKIGLGGERDGAETDAGAGDAGPRPAVRFDRVTARAVQGASDLSLSVAIELTVIGAMPHVAPSITVDAACDSATDRTEHAFFQSLGGAAVGDQRADTVELFLVPGLKAMPARCELTLGATGGATALAHYCFTGGATTPGACPPAPPTTPTL